MDVQRSNDGDLGTQEKIYQNVVRDCTYAGIRLRELSEDMRIVNNTIDNCSNSEGGGIVLISAGQTRNVIKNNIVTNSSYALNAHEQTTKTFTADYNCYHDGTKWAYNLTAYYSLAAWQTIGEDAHSSTSDPFYVNEAGNDFRLRTGSPFMNYGIDVLDLDGDGSTTDPITIGAYITGTEIIGIIRSSAPAAPAGLRIVQ
jgi:hypothetical protein